MGGITGLGVERNVEMSQVELVCMVIKGSLPHADIEKRLVCDGVGPATCALLVVP